MSTLAREPRIRRFYSTTATTTHGLTFGCQPKRRLDSRQIRPAASRFYWTSTTAAVTASAIRAPNKFAAQPIYLLLCSGNSAIRNFSRQDRSRRALLSGEGHTFCRSEADHHIALGFAQLRRHSLQRRFEEFSLLFRGQSSVSLTHLRQSAAISFRTIKFWSGFAGD